MARDQRNLERELDSLLAAYHDACPAPDATPEFMPKLWARIDARQSSFGLLKRWTEGFVAAAAAACLVVVLLQVAPDDSRSVVYQSTYLEALTQDTPTENSIFVDVASVVDPEHYSDNR